ncbi:CoA transferase [Leucobacter chromiireducens]|uniref:CoA transferase n=1 Tax=Leucobacter chromiireducens TaxID=283877 RepID=UPI000F639A83|nr:CoA transferase [Leucobacter chromiireducens]
MGRFGAAWLTQIGIGAERSDPDQGGSAAPVPLRARLPVGELAADAVTVLAAAMELARAGLSGAPRAAAVQVDPERVAASFRSDQLGRIDGTPFPVWAPLSGFFAAGDGWVRTHANYAWHAAALAGVLGVDVAAPDVAARAAEVIRDRSARELEREVFAAGGLAVAVRDAATWADERRDAGVSADGGAIGFGVRSSGHAAACRALPNRAPGAFPLAGVRVLDLTRVIAGPVGTRTLASLGADVLRVDGPNRDEPFWQWLDTGRGKRSTLLDLRARADVRTLRELVATADVVVCGARPGALAHAGVDPDQLAADYPGAVIASVAAWEPGGVWGARRGFDSLVQAASGIALLESPGDGVPGKLPAQALDHSAGALLAAGVLSLLARGTGGRVETRLEGIAAALLRAGAGEGSLGAGSLSEGEGAAVPAPELSPAVATPWGALQLAGPPYRPAWQEEPEPWAGHPWGEDRPVWLARGAAPHARP